MRSEFKPDDEEGRVKALLRLDLLDTPSEPPFENIVSLIQRTLNVPMCAITLIDSERQWFKARRGVEVSETARDISFCTHAIQNDQPLIVGETLDDPRFRYNPYVTGEPFIRSYAGIPLKIHDGYQIGTLCAIDTRPREFSVTEIDLLQQFAKSVLSEFELRRTAAIDPLTRALSRRGWEECATSQFRLSQQDKLPLSIAILDIDHFRSINDRFGHSAGDQILATLAAVCMETIREDDFFGRLGGEEFAILFPDTCADAAREIAENLRIGFEQVEHRFSETVTATVSAGVAERIPGDKEIAALVDRADLALCEAKRSGRNRVAVAPERSWEQSEGLVA
jgi:diguanylate cyclase (GGDEF)-like protein